MAAVYWIALKTHFRILSSRFCLHSSATGKRSSVPFCRPKWFQAHNLSQVLNHGQPSNNCKKVSSVAEVVYYKHFATERHAYLEENEGRSPDAEQFKAIYRFPHIRLFQVISRLKLIQTAITIVLLPPVYFLCFQGAISSYLVSCATALAAFAAVMLYSLTYYLRRFIGMMYMNESGTMLKVSHLTFWGRRNDIYVPVKNVMTLADTGDSRHETVMQFKRYDTSDVLYFTLRYGQIMDKQKFSHVFGEFK